MEFLPETKYRKVLAAVNNGLLAILKVPETSYSVVRIGRGLGWILVGPTFDQIFKA
jgi:hypothetical protein